MTLAEQADLISCCLGRKFTHTYQISDHGCLGLHRCAFMSHRAKYAITIPPQTFTLPNHIVCHSVVCDVVCAILVTCARLDPDSRDALGLGLFQQLDSDLYITYSKMNAWQQ